MFHFLFSLRQWAIRRLIGRMPVCMNMIVVNGSLEYGGKHGAICENNRFAEGYGT